MSADDGYRIPTRLYVLRTGQLWRQLDKLHNRYMNGYYGKSQVNLYGQRYITEMGETLKSDVARWIKQFKQGSMNSQIRAEIDKITREKIAEWEKIVDDM